MLNEPKGFGQFDPVIFGLRFNIDGALSSAKARSFLPLVWSATHFGPGPEHAEYFERRATRTTGSTRLHTSAFAFTRAGASMTC